MYPIDRGTMIAVLARLDGGNTDIYPAAPFVDSVPGSEYEKALNWAYANHIIYGTDDTHFSPDNVVTRQDFSTILMRYLCEYRGYYVETAPLDFTDSSTISAYAAAPVQQALGIGLLTGYDDHTFRPKNSITRAECAALILRAADYLTAHPVPTSMFDPEPPSEPIDPVVPEIVDPYAPVEPFPADEIPFEEEYPVYDDPVVEPIPEEMPAWLN